MDHGITLKDSQWLQGSSFAFPVQTAFGPSFVPNQSNERPNIGNITGPSVILANNNIIDGFSMRSAFANVSGTDIQNLVLSNSEFRDSLVFDINFTNVSGNIKLLNNTSFSANGLHLHSGYYTSLLLQGNNFANKGDFNMDIAFNGFSHSTVILQNRNEFHDSLAGSLITADDFSIVQCKVKDNLFTAIPDGTPYCLKILATGSSTLTTVVNQNLFRSSAPGLALETDVHATANWYVVDNNGLYTGFFSPIYPFAFKTDGFSTATLLLAANSAEADGYALDNASGFATFNAESPTLDLSGIELLNTGSFSTSGTITYVPYDPTLIPIIE
jgi:hypothetical protein